MEILERLQIFQVRGHVVVLDSDLAAVYEVQTRALNQAIRRNADRFPEDFSFVLTKEEHKTLKSQLVISSSHGGRRTLPRVFTEHGAIMAASVLNSDRAVAMSVYVVRAFVRMREEFLSTVMLEKRLAEIEQTLSSHDTALTELFELIRPLLNPSEEDQPQRRIGFHHPEKEE